MIEDDLKSLRLFVPAREPRERVLAAAGGARRQQKQARLIHGIALASMALMVLTYVFGTRAELRRANVSDPELRPHLTWPLKGEDS